MKAFLIWMRAPFLDKIPGMWETHYYRVATPEQHFATFTDHCRGKDLAPVCT